MESNRSGRIAWVPLLIVIAAALLLLQNLSYAREDPFSFQRTWESPSFVCAGPEGTMAVIEASKTRIAVLDAEGRIRARIRGGSRAADGFYYAEYAAMDGESLYVADVTHGENSSRVERERILRFSLDGQYLETLYAVEYAGGEAPLQLGNIRCLSTGNGKAYFAARQGGGWALYALGESVTLLRHADAVGETVQHAGYDPATDTLAFTTKQGGLFCDRGGSVSRLPYGDGERVLWAAASAGGDLFVTDLLHQRLVRVQPGEPLAVWEGGQFYSLSVADGRVAVTDNARVFLLDRDGNALYDGTGAPLGRAFILHMLLFWLSALCIALTVLWLAIRLCAILWRARRKEGGNALLIGMVMLLTAGLVTLFIVSSYKAQMDDTSQGDLERTTAFLSRTSGETFGEAFSRLNSLSDYNNADYRAVRRYMDAVCDESLSRGLNMYYILYKYNADLIWGVMDYEDTNGVVYPYMPFAGSGYDQVALTGELMSVAAESDAYGTWSYAVAPVYNADGETVGVLEVGANRYSETLARRALVRRILSTTVAALIMVLLLLGEANAYRDCLRLRHNAQSGARFTVLEFLRPIVCLVFLADNFDASYIPQLSARLFGITGLSLDVNMAAALPMSAQLFAIAAAALWFGGTADRRGIAYTVKLGAAVRVLGGLLAVCAIARESYALLLLAKLLGGLGTGAVMVGCDALPSCTTDENQRTRLFAGLNVGLMAGVVLGASLGGYAAQYLGYTAAYCIAAGLMLLCGALSLFAVHADAVPALSQAADGREKAGTFLSRPPVFAFLLFLLIPFMVMLYFKEYVFPLYGASLGRGEAEIGNVLLIGGSAPILCGTALSAYMFRRFGVKRAMVMASGLLIAALLLFSAYESYVTAVLAVCLIGLSGAFGMAGQGVYFSGLAEGCSIGSGRAMGIYSLTDNLGQACGPLLLGALLFMGYGRSMGLAAAVCGLLLGLFILLSREGKAQQKQNREGDLHADR